MQPSPAPQLYEVQNGGPQLLRGVGRLGLPPQRPAALWHGKHILGEQIAAAGPISQRDRVQQGLGSRSQCTCTWARLLSTTGSREAHCQNLPHSSRYLDMRRQAEGVGAGEAIDGCRTQLVAGCRAKVAAVGVAAAVRVPHVAAGLRGDAVPADLGLERRLRAGGSTNL